MQVHEKVVEWKMRKNLVYQTPQISWSGLIEKVLYIRCSIDATLPFYFLTIERPMNITDSRDSCGGHVAALSVLGTFSGAILLVLCVLSWEPLRRFLGFIHVLPGYIYHFQHSKGSYWCEEPSSEGWIWRPPWKGRLVSIEDNHEYVITVPGIRVRTRDGMTLNIDVSCEYKYTEEEGYRPGMDHFKTRLRGIVLDAISTLASDKTQAINMSRVLQEIVDSPARSVTSKWPLGYRVLRLYVVGVGDSVCIDQDNSSTSSL